ncbi:nucleotide kinase domain-containing protein [Acinetobacter baumannii]|uniref:nucleotide kinase domain-containing protein n=1 Tax=Acinetobacter baumannii TaxID=470 RepID=UPI00244B965F|nr:nucleotide kinase domain-containing protein [Acinetobacter baumannii]MDH2570952.1 putative DNA base hypermodification protein [Acinetobacter baumannii]
MKLELNLGFDYYWHFTHERQKAFLNKCVTSKINTSDVVINKYKFTNTYRCLDRTSQFLIKNIINHDNQDPNNVFFRIMIFKLFNKVSTWQLLEQRLGEVNIEYFSVTSFAEILDQIKEYQPIYSNAYIVPSGMREYGRERKHENNLLMLKFMLDNNFQDKIWELKNLKDIYDLFISVPTLGPFLAYQYAIDIAYSEFSEAKESDFIIAGPGAIRGIQKCFKNISPKQYSSVIFWMYENQSKYLENFVGLNNRCLQLIDCQNIFCEVDKYLRIALPELTSNRKKIKQVYKANLDKIEIQTPRKWNLIKENLFII